MRYRLRNVIFIIVAFLAPVTITVLIISVKLKKDAATLSRPTSVIMTFQNKLEDSSTAAAWLTVPPFPGGNRSIHQPKNYVNSVSETARTIVKRNRQNEPDIYASKRRHLKINNVVTESNWNKSNGLQSFGPFRYTIDNPILCGSDFGASLFLVNYVHSAVAHFDQRGRIRSSWARQSNYPDVRTRTVFFVGRAQSVSIQTALETEAKQYGDIVQANFIDAYRNMTLKALSALQWITSRCHRAQYFLKADDDAFVNLFAAIKHLNDLHTSNYRRGLLMCLIWSNPPVARSGKWAIAEQEFADKNYPTYCCGLGYIISPDVAAILYQASFGVPFFWVDDVYLTGLVVQALRGTVRHTNMTGAYCKADKMAAIYSHSTEWCKYIFTQVHDDRLYVKTWQVLRQVAESQRIPTPAVIRPGVLADQYIPLSTMLWLAEKKRQNRFKHRIIIKQP